MQKVFLVDDSAMVRQRLADLLAGVPQVSVVGQAAGADEAIRQILDVKPDLVLLDLSLWQGNGFDVLRAVHAKAPAIDIYMLSNFCSAPYRQHAAELGACDFFDKTNEFERVRDVVAQRAARSEALKGAPPCPPSSH